MFSFFIDLRSIYIVYCIMQYAYYAIARNSCKSKFDILNKKNQ